MMKMLRAMREPLKYVQGRDALLQFHKEMEYMGKRWLFVCSNSGYKACHEKLEKSFGTSDDYRRYEIFGGISSNGEIKKMMAIVEEDKIDTVVAVGAVFVAVFENEARFIHSCNRQQSRYGKIVFY